LRLEQVHPSDDPEPRHTPWSHPSSMQLGYLQMLSGHLWERTRANFLQGHLYWYSVYSCWSL